jgi:hypothetical protein
MDGSQRGTLEDGWTRKTGLLTYRGGEIYLFSVQQLDNLVSHRIASVVLPFVPVSMSHALSWCVERHSGQHLAESQD